MSTVKIHRLTPRRRRPKSNGSGQVTDKAYCRAFVDGYLVTKTAGRDWECSCLDVDCDHPNILADLLTPAALDELEEGDDE